MFASCAKEIKRKRREERNAQGSTVEFKNFKMNFYNEESLIINQRRRRVDVFVNHNKPIMVQDCMEVRLGRYFVFFTLGMLCLGAAHLSMLCFSVFWYASSYYVFLRKQKNVFNRRQLKKGSWTHKNAYLNVHLNMYLLTVNES